jgi:hypothetical protein
MKASPVHLSSVKRNGGTFPRFYEVMLKVSYENSKPVQISNVVHSELKASGNLVSSAR